MHRITETTCGTERINETCTTHHKAQDELQDEIKSIRHNMTSIEIVISYKSKDQVKPGPNDLIEC